MSYGSDEPTWEEIIAEAVRAGVAKVHTSMPAVVVAYDPTTQSASVQPVLVGRVADTLLDRERPDVAPPPPLHNVPIVWPSGATWSLHGPLVPGDPVTLVIAERSTDEWRTLGSTAGVVPLDARRFDLSDAVAIPGGRTFAAAGTAAPLGATAVDPAAVVLAGALVKLGSGPGATEPLMLGATFLSQLGTFLAAVALDTVDSPATAAAATDFLTELGANPPISLKVLTE